MSRGTRALTAIALAGLLAAAAPAAGAPATTVGEFKIDREALCELRDRFVERTLATHRPGTWAELKMDLTDDDLALMGLPPAEVLKSRSYKKPTLVTKDGRFQEVELPAVASFAGTGCFGIRPGAWLLLLSGGGIGWCSMAHVYGSPGAYDISTAGHCGKNGDTATVIAAFGNRAGLAGPVLLDFGKFATSRDGGLGSDWALIDIDPAYQHLVTPTMCFWGGPRGMYTKVGDVATYELPRRGLVPKVTVTPDPFLAQGVVHYGHGLGVGPGGTPRAGAAISWRPDHSMFWGVLSPGDSGSGTNTLTGDSVGANMEAAGINTHIWVDLLMRQGLGIMGGTRATEVSGTLANGQIVPYPVPLSGLP